MQKNSFEMIMLKNHFSTRILRNIFSIILFSCVIAPQSKAQAEDAFPTSLARHVHDASIIARIRIISRTPVWEGGLAKKGEQLAQQHRCGYWNHAKVVESFKGESSDFSFFSATDQDFKGYDRDYLVFVYKRDAAEAKRIAKQIASTMMTDEQAGNTDLSCKSFGEYYVSIPEQMMFPFDPEASKLFPGEWLSNFNRRTMVFCGGSPTGDFVERLKDENDHSSAVIEWKGIKKMIDTAMKNRFKFWINEGDRLGGC